MGIAGSMKENMRENMENQMRFQKELIVKQRQMQMATQIAMGRERFWYYECFYFTALAGLAVGAVRSRNPMTLAPLVPLSFAYFYQRDMFYGDMLHRVQAGVDELLVDEPTKFLLPAHSGIMPQQEYLDIMRIVDGKKKI